MTRTKCFPRMAQGVLLLAIALLVVGFCLAQLRAQTLPPTQDGINYYLASEVTEMKRRIGEIEQMYRYGMGVLLANLIAHVLQIRAVQRAKRDPSREE